MSDFDDYFDDDVVFDAQTLAALDREEEKYFTQEQPPPPAKRQKTNDGGSKAPPVKRFPSFNDFDSFPDISLEFDGNYTAQDTSTLNAAYRAPAIPAQQRMGQAGSSRAINHSNRMPAPSFDFSMQAGTGPIATSTPVNAPQNTRINGNIGRAQHRPPASLHQSAQMGNPMLVDSTSAGKVTEELQQQLNLLKSRFEELSKENAKIQAALKESITAKQAKEGEVTILRKGIERTAKTHADQIASLRVEKDEAISTRMQLQKEMRDQLERMKTELSFKHSEQESIRAALNSRNKKADENSKGYRNTQSTKEASQATFPSATPMGAKPQARKQSKNPFLPGFQNAFDNGPSQSRVQVQQPPHSPSKHSDLHRRASQMKLDVPFHPSTESQSLNTVEDILMVDDQQDMTDELNQLDLEDHAGMSPASDEFHFEPVNPTSELIRIIFTHTASELTQSTIHLLLQETAPDNMAGSTSNAYNEYSLACDRMLGSIATSPGAEDFPFIVQSVTQTIITILPILRKWNSWSCMTAALDLLATLLYTLPNFGPTIFSAADSLPGHPLLRTLLDIVGERQDHLPENVIAQLVAVLEALCFNADDRVVEGLAFIPSRWQNLINLLNQSNSLGTWLKISRFLAILASHRDLCRTILSMPDTPSDPEKPQAPVKIPLIERLCLILVENMRHTPESSEMKRSILTFFALLSTSQPDVHNHLLLSTSVIPAVILFLSQLTTPFWEDDEELLLADSADVLSRIRMINQTLFFLHYLIFSSASLLNLRQKLYAASHRVFYGLIHPFVVTFGRLTYGEAPDWVGERGKAELMALTDIARDILDHVLDGPEADRTWQTYTNDQREEDEEEMEAELLGHRTG